MNINPIKAIILSSFAVLAVSLQMSVAQNIGINIQIDSEGAQLSYVLNEIKAAAIKENYSVKVLSRLNFKVNENIVVRIISDSITSVKIAKDENLKIPDNFGWQSYAIRVKNTSRQNTIYILAGDKTGAMYGGLDIAEAISIQTISTLKNSDNTPYINLRGIKFNIPLDARTPSYSDNGDAAQQNIENMWDVNFWHEFLDEMARDRFNMLSLWSLSPFPSLVDVPEYPNAGLQDVKKTTSKLLPTTDAWQMSTEASLANLVTVKKISLTEKIAFWKDIMQYANDRGIDCYLFTWNLFTYGTEHSGYGFTDKITDTKTKDYIRKATKELIKTYPLLKGIGLTSGENMYRLSEVEKENFLYESYGEGINDALKADPNKSFKLIHRTHQADIGIIKNAFSGLNQRCTQDFSYKYSVAQMYSSVAPNYIHESKFLDHIGDSKFFLTVRDDAWYNLRGGSDPAFARAYFKNMPTKNFEGFYLGPDGYTWGRDYLSKTPEHPNRLVIKKRWYSFNILGRLAYDPNIPDSHFTDLLAHRFKGINAKNLQEAWAKASQVLPWVNRFHNERSQNDFQWYPEGCTSFYGFRTIDNFIKSAPQKGEGLLSIPVYSHALLNKQTIAGTTPVQVAENLQQISNEALILVADMRNSKDKELVEIIGDIEAMSYLGNYYANKILGATNKHLFDKSPDHTQKLHYKNEAIQSLKKAADYWDKYAKQVSDSYVPQHLTRMHFTVDFKAMQAHVDKEVLMLTGNNLPQTGLDSIPPLQQLEVVFSNASSYYFWHLDKMSLPADWSAKKYMVMEVFATSKQPFDLILQTQTDTIVKKGLKAVEKEWTRVVIPLETIKKEYAKNKSTHTFQHYANISPLLLTEVLGFGVSMGKPMGNPVLEIRSVKLLNEEPGNSVLSSIHL